MLNLAIIFHMHQPYYKNLLTQETEVPWVRLHGIKDYLDMVQMVEKFPSVRLTFNLVPSLLEQVEDYTNGLVKDKFLELSYKPAAELTDQDKHFIVEKFFSIHKDRVIAIFPRYYELYLKRQAKKAFTTQDYLDVQVCFNMAWFDPYFRDHYSELRAIVNKGRFFTEEEKHSVLEKQLEVIEEIIPAYKKAIARQQVEVTANPYYHPILPLLYSTNIAKEANAKTVLPKRVFSYPQDVKAQIESAVKFYQGRFGVMPVGMWPSEESVCEHILPFIINAGIQWIVSDEALLFKSIKKKKRDTLLLYQPHLLKRGAGNLNIIFRDRNLSDLIGFVYHSWKAEDAVTDLMKHLENIEKSFRDKNILVTIAMDGENAWEYYANDGHDFLESLYKRLSESKVVKTVIVSEYLKNFPATHEIKRLAAGSWISADFSKWIGNPYKVKAWEYLAQAREELHRIQEAGGQISELAWKQMYIAEGSDWFWWQGEDYPGYFDRLYRMHLTNLYQLLDKPVPEYLKKPIEP